MKSAAGALLALTLAAAATAGGTEDDVRRFEEAQRQIRVDHEQAEAEEARERAALRAQQLADEPARLRRMEADRLCVELGDAARQGDPQLLRLAEAEVRRRGLAVSTRFARQEQVAIGDRLCQVLASWGLPDNQRRITVAGRVSITLYYGTRSAVEVTNGRVTAIVN